AYARAAAPAPDVPRAGAAAKAIGVREEPARFLSVFAPEGWQSPAFDDSAWKGPAPGPFVPGAIVVALRGGSPPQSPGSGTQFAFHHGAPLYLRSRFDVDDPTRARVLELRVRYADGFVAYLNGREIVRRGLGPGRDARPAQPHGPEVERVYLPVAPEVTGPLQAKGNLLAIEIRSARAPASVLAPLAPAGDLHVAVAGGIRIVRGPYLVAPSEGRDGAGLSIAWETDLPGTGVVTIEPAGGRKGERPRVVRSGPAALRQVVAVTGLEHGRRYQYRVQATATATAAPATAATGAGDVDTAGPFVIDTLPDRSRPFRF